MTQCHALYYLFKVKGNGNTQKNNNKSFKLESNCNTNHSILDGTSRCNSNQRSDDICTLCTRKDLVTSAMGEVTVK